MNVKWKRNGSAWMQTEKQELEDKLAVGIYNISLCSKTGLYLTLKEHKFDFPFKLYGSEPQFAERVKKAYLSTKGNLGVLFTGLKGTGKTVTAEIICNTLNLPVVIVDTDWKELLIPFMNSIEQNIIFFFDEFEKVFPSDYAHASKLLPIMDGVLRNDSRKVFLLTTNSLNVEESMLSRPGRIRYLKNYGNLDVTTITEIVDDKLVNKSFRADLIKYIAGLEVITIDIVSSLVEETNIFNEAPVAYASFFNVKTATPKNDIYKLVINEKTKEWEEVLVKFNAKISPSCITEDVIGHSLQINHRYIGEIVEIKEGGSFVIKEVIDDPDDADKEIEKFNTYRIEPVPAYHYNYQKAV